MKLDVPSARSARRKLTPAATDEILFSPCLVDQAVIGPRLKLSDRAFHSDIAAYFYTHVSWFRFHWRAAPVNYYRTAVSSHVTIDQSD
jgi:hypothetical protein